MCIHHKKNKFSQKIDLNHKNNSTNTPFSFFFLKNRIKNKKNTDNNSCLSTENEAKHCKIRKIKENSRKFPVYIYKQYGSYTTK